VTEPTPPEVGRWTGMGEALVRFALFTIAIAVAVGAIGAVVAVATGHDAAGGNGWNNVLAEAIGGKARQGGQEHSTQAVRCHLRLL